MVLAVSSSGLACPLAMASAASSVGATSCVVLLLSYDCFFSFVTYRRFIASDWVQFRKLLLTRRGNSVHCNGSRLILGWI